jgi:hypothetical protein
MNLAQQAIGLVGCPVQQQLGAKIDSVPQRCRDAVTV